MRIDLLALRNERFEECCQALLREEFPRFQAFSPPDRGMDGYDSDSQTIFQAYFPERAPRKDKVTTDLEKAGKNAWACKQWILLIPKNPSAVFKRWLCEEQQAMYPFSIEVWGKTEIVRLLRKHKSVLKAYFGEKKRSREKPRPGDAMPGLEISPDQAEEIRSLISKAAEEEAARKRRKARGYDFSREYGEFYAYFKLSSYERLPAEEFFEALDYFRKKLNARKYREPLFQTRLRLVKTIKTIQKKLKIPDSNYRQLLRDLTGKSSSKEIDIPELKKVAKYFQRLQAETEAKRI